MIQDLVKLVPSEIENESGKVFYSGRLAFSKRESVYLLGINPGGDPKDSAETSIKTNCKYVLETAPDRWSEYTDESWQGAEPGAKPYQKRVKHLLERAGLDPREVPSSNAIFLRSRRENDIASRRDALAKTCWPFHAGVIRMLRPRVIICLGATAFQVVSRQLGQVKLLHQFRENNNRGWVSGLWRSADGLRLLALSHPSIADWTRKETDPSPLLVEALR